MIVPTMKTISSIKQGDACSIPVMLFFNGAEINSEVVEMLEAIEFAFEDQTPVSVPAAEAWNAELGAFLLPVTQQMTFAMDVGNTTLDVRVQFRGGDVLGVREKAKIKVVDATSEEVLNYA